MTERELEKQLKLIWTFMVILSLVLLLVAWREYTDYNQICNWFDETIESLEALTNIVKQKL